MEIKVCTTNELCDEEWYTYQQSFNIVFKKEFDIEFFKHKYYTVINDNSYHALLLNEERSVVGGCSVCPFLYKNGEEIIKIGQAVDVFILEEYRTDPLMLRKMYVQLKKLLIINDIKAVMAVPNATAYPYWKSIVKWKDVGDLSYWMFPIRLGNIIKKWYFINIISLIFSYIWIHVNSLMVLIANNTEKLSLYELITDDAFCKNRYTQEHIKIQVKDIIFYFRVYDEDGVKTAYLIDASQNDRLTFKAMFNGVAYIFRNTNADMVLYVGQLKMFQTLLIKVPKKFEPKRLPLTCDILRNEDMNKYSKMLEFKNWNFGLLNFDVR